MSSSLTGAQPCPLVYMLSTAAFVLQLHSQVVAAKSLWPEKLKYFLSSLVEKKVVHSSTRAKKGSYDVMKEGGNQELTGVKGGRDEGRKR